MFASRIARFSARATPTIQSAQASASKLLATAEPVLYYGKVAFEFLAQIAKHQHILSPGSWAQANSGLTNFIGGLRNGAWKQVTLSQTKPFVGAGVQLTGFFLVGEMIGRQSIIGYKTPSADHH